MVFALAAAVVVITPVAAQPPTYFTVTPEGLNMRLAALGDASCSQVLDVGSMFGNPASLNHLQERGVIATHIQDRLTRGSVDQVAATVFSTNAFAVALNGTVSHGGGIRPEGVSPFPAREFGGDLAVAYAFLPTLSAGVLAGIRKTEIASLPSTNVWTQVGILYYPSPGISYGATYRVRKGATYWFANAQNGFDKDTPVRQGVEIGATMTFPARSDRPVATLSLSTEKFFPGISLASTKGGLEYLPVEFLALRIGFKVGSFERAARFGLGILVDPFRVDVAVGPSMSDDRFAGVSLFVRL
jgi:hypothetical protein